VGTGEDVSAVDSDVLEMDQGEIIGAPDDAQAADVDSDSTGPVPLDDGDGTGGDAGQPAVEVSTSLDAVAGDACAVDACGGMHAGMVFVPAGTFFMGCNPVTDGECVNHPQENPQHEVTLDAFWIDVHEVTTTAYKACVDAGACAAPNTLDCGGWQPGQPMNNWSGATNAPKPGREQHPVNCINWFQARAYCLWRGGALPTEAQWEKAARGGCEKYAGQDCKTALPVYPWGSTAPTCDLAVYKMEGVPPGESCDGAATAPVGSKPAGASPYGVLDMAGNVFEWLQDRYHPNFYAVSPATNPDNEKKQIGEIQTFGRVVRGGSFVYGNDCKDSLTCLRAGARNGTDAWSGCFICGVRCVGPAP